MANFLGTSEANIRNYRKDKEPRMAILVKIAESLEINFDWLLIGKGEMMRKNVSQTITGNRNTTGDVVGGDKIIHGGKDEMLAEKERRLIDIHETFISEAQKFREMLRAEMDKFHEVQKEKDVYVERIIKCSYERNRENMQRIDILIEQNKMMIEQNNNLQDTIRFLIDKIK
ncbi:MAG: hypothetical protein LBR34_05480 [Prevotella sp.]|nr:hypothetical protein [Prevotella sp.]